jgi:hypothetical protein
MYSVIRRSLTGLCLLLALNQVRADSGWSLLKLGMSGADVAAVLGRPLLCSKGRGFERWTYDNGAEVLLRGLLIGWTAPGLADVGKRSSDVWQSGNADTFAAAAALPASSQPASAVGSGTGRLNGTGVVNRAAFPRWLIGRPSLR